MRKCVLCLGVLLLLLSSGCATVKSDIFSCMISADRSISDLKPASVSIEGQTLSYLERPGKGETIVLVHGFGADKDNWIRFVRHLPKEYRVLAFDMPGHGESTIAAGKVYSIDFMAASLAQAVDALGLKNFHLAGNSMGGYISILYASRNQDRVTTLGLLDSAGLLAASPQPSDLKLALREGKSPLTPTNEDEFIELLDYAFYKKPFMPWPAKSVLAGRMIGAHDLKKKIWTDLNSHDVDLMPLLPSLRLPVLVIWGDRDRILHISTASVLSRALPNSETVIMKDCGHMPMLERPKETALHYVSFLDKHTAK